VLVALRSDRPLMPYRRHITIRRQSGGALCTFRLHANCPSPACTISLGIGPIIPACGPPPGLKGLEAGRCIPLGHGGLLRNSQIEYVTCWLVLAVAW
jgi:hypothetical protein